MGLITALKRAVGSRIAKTGTEHFWQMKVSSFALLILIPSFLFTVGTVVGEDHEHVTAYLARPLPALIAALTLIVGFEHFKLGATTMIEDYAKGVPKKVCLISLSFISYSAMATGLYALTELAF